MNYRRKIDIEEFLDKITTLQGKNIKITYMNRTDPFEIRNGTRTLGEYKIKKEIDNLTFNLEFNLSLDVSDIEVLEYYDSVIFMLTYSRQEFLELYIRDDFDF